MQSKTNTDQISSNSMRGKKTVWEKLKVNSVSVLTIDQNFTKPKPEMFMAAESLHKPKLCHTLCSCIY